MQKLQGVFLAILSLFPCLVFSQSHFTFQGNTGVNATIAIPTSIRPDIEGNELSVGDEIAVFNREDECVGAVQWTGQNTVLTVWGKNPLTPELGGIDSGDTMNFRIWDHQAEKEYSIVIATFSQGNGVFQPDGIYVLSGLHAFSRSPSEVQLSSPGQWAIVSTFRPSFSWECLDSLATFELQVSTSSRFSPDSILVHLKGLTADSCQIPTKLPLNHTHYYWRVRASSVFGEGEWSDPNEFYVNVSAASFAPNHIQTTLTDRGRIGFLKVNDPNSGIGFRYQNGPNLLCEGGILMGTDAQHIMSAIRGEQNNQNELEYHNDFFSFEPTSLVLKNPGEFCEYEMQVSLYPSHYPAPLSLWVNETAFASDADFYRDFLVLRFSIHNWGTAPVTDLYFGLFFDWDIDAEHFQSNSLVYDAASRLALCRDHSGNVATLVGVAAPSEVPTLFYGILNDQNAPDNPGWGIYDGFTDEEKWQALSGGVQNTNLGPGDVSMVIGYGPVTIAPEDSVDFDFVLLAGNTKADLQQSLQYANTFRRKLVTTAVTAPGHEIGPNTYQLLQNYPNPFNSSTLIQYTVPQRESVVLEVFNCFGQKVKVLVQDVLSPGIYRYYFDGSDLPSGLYWLRLQMGDVLYSRKIMLIK